MRKTFAIFGLLLILSIPSIKSLLPRGGYTSHDLTHHIVRQIDMDKLLAEGQFPPRWSGDLGSGFGYPLFLFNYPSPYIFGEVFHKAGLNFVESVKAVMLVSMLISVIGMYLFLDSLFPNQKMAAFLGAIFYLYAPIRFIDIYVSGSVGTALAMGVLPFIFWLIVKEYKGSKSAVPIGGILIALLITSHNVTALMFAPVFIVFSLILVYLAENRLRLLRNLGFMAAIGLGLSAFFWIPAIVEKKYIIYDQVMKNSWINQFPTVAQLVHSPWGYGLAHPGVSEPGGMSFQIGLTQILVMAILPFVLIIFRKKKEMVVWGIFGEFVFLVAIFLMQKISTPFWVHLPLLYLVQYPFRFLAVDIFAASIAATLIIRYLPFKKVLFVILLTLVIYSNRNHLNINQRFDPGDDYYAALRNQESSYDEDLPSMAFLPTSPSPGKLQILAGDGNVHVTENKSIVVKAAIDVSTKATLRFNQFYFPGWVLKVNNQPLQFSTSELEGSHYLPVFNLNSGSYNFEADFLDTPDRKIADIVSMMTLSVISGIILLSLWPKIFGQEKG